MEELVTGARVVLLRSTCGVTGGVAAMAIVGKEQLEQMCAEPHEIHCVKGRESAGSCFLSSPLLLLFHLRRVDCGWPPSLYLILQLLCVTWLL